MKSLSCPVALGKKCTFLELASMHEDEINTAMELVKISFPHMNIPEHFWKRKLHSDDTMLLKENGQKIIGIVNISCRDSMMASIDLLAVVPGYQGKGLGSTLLQASEDVARNHGKNMIELMTEQVKPENVAFYSKNGYKVTGFDPRGYEHSPSVKFSKDL